MYKVQSTVGGQKLKAGGVQSTVGGQKAGGVELVQIVDKKVKQGNHMEYKVGPGASLSHQEAICHLADLHRTTKTSSTLKFLGEYWAFVDLNLLNSTCQWAEF